MGLKITGLVKFIPNASGGDANLTVSSANYSGTSFSTSSQTSNPRDFFFNSSGTKMFVVGASVTSGTNDFVYQYTLTTGFDMSTASYDNVSFSVSGQDTGASGIHFNSTGTRMFMVGAGNDSVYQYTLGTGFDLSTASYDSISLDISAQETNANNVFCNPAGTKMFVVGNGSDAIYEYNL